MSLRLCFVALLNLSVLSLVDAEQNPSMMDNWHHWRGPLVTGVAPKANPPVNWSETSGIAWKVEVPGDGSSTPIVWSDKVYLLTAINTGIVDASLPRPEDQPKRVFGITFPNTSYDFVVICLDRKTGDVLWQKTATRQIPHEGHHNDCDFAPASPTTDGERLYCWFGSAGMYCYDLEGSELWRRNLGKAHVGASLGEGCSPVIYDGKLVVVRDHSRQSSIEVLDAKTGNTLWRKQRDEPNAWATPRVIEHSGKTQVITAASNYIRSYDLNTGEIIWQCSGLTGNVIPCPMVDGDHVICMSGYQGYSIMSVPMNLTGDFSDQGKLRWSGDRGTPYVPSPVLDQGILYFNQSNQNILTCLDAETGKPFYERKRLQLSNIYASPVAAAGRVYITDRRGKTLVLRRGKEFEVLATNQLDERFDASPAIAGEQLFLRGAKHIYCIQQK